MIFSAGLGTRFKPWTDKHPKALAIVNGKSLLQRNVEWLQHYGIRELIVNVHHFADQVIDAIDKNKGWGSTIHISDERDRLLDTGGGLLKAKSFFTAGERFITCNVDILTDLNLNKLLAFHEKEKPLVSFGVTERKTSRYFLFDETNRLCGWKNISTGEQRMADDKEAVHKKELKAYSCVVIFEYDIFRLTPFTGKFSLVDLYLELAAEHKIMGYDHSGGNLIDVGKPESIVKAEALFT